MADERADGPDLVILRDGTGAYYALPQPWLERLRLPADEHGALDGLAGGDTAGFAGRAGATSFEALGVLPYRGYEHLPGVVQFAAQFSSVPDFDHRSFPGL
jgi:hypothetical protein